MRFEVLTVVNVKVFWDVTPCSQVGTNVSEGPAVSIFRVCNFSEERAVPTLMFEGIYCRHLWGLQRFGRTWCLHVQGLNVSEKPAVRIFKDPIVSMAYAAPFIRVANISEKLSDSIFMFSVVW
jgi:hypothetical protein